MNESQLLISIHKSLSIILICHKNCQLNPERFAFWLNKLEYKAEESHTLDGNLAKLICG